MSNPVLKFVESLGKWDLHYPLPGDWIVSISIAEEFFNKIQKDLQELERAPRPRNGITVLKNWGLDGGEFVHCFFVDRAELGGETLTMQSANIGDGNMNGGLIQGIYSGGRADFASRALNISFRETANSFADFMIRPWILYAGHVGRIADELGQSAKAIVRVYSYGKRFSNVGEPVLRKTTEYHGCTPIKIENKTLDYTTDSSIITYSTEWCFDRLVVH